jgi:preprotein translocase subunit SecG
MEGLQIFLLVLQIIIAISMIILVLLQKSDGNSLSGIGGSSSGLNSLVSSKLSSSILSKITMFLIALFMINSLVLASISKSSNKAIEKDLKKAIEQEEKSQTPSKPSVPDIQ